MELLEYLYQASWWYTNKKERMHQSRTRTLWKHCDGTGALLRVCSNMSSCQEGNIQIAALLISVDENFFVEKKTEQIQE